MSAEAKKQSDIVLPPSLTSRSDLARLARELELVENELQAQRVRGVAEPRLPALSQGLNDFVEQNKVDLNSEKTVNDLKQKMRQLEAHAPSVHMTFAVSADSESLAKLIAWLRQEINPQILIGTSVQPSLVGGVYLRTPDKVHDFSLKALLADKRELMVKQLEALNG